MSNVLENSILGFCKWDILALIVLAVAVVVFEVRQRKLKKNRGSWRNGFRGFTQMTHLKPVNN